MEPVCRHAGPYDAGELQAAFAPGKDVVCRHQDSCHVLCVDGVPPVSGADQVVCDLSCLSGSDQFDAVPTFCNKIIMNGDGVSLTYRDRMLQIDQSHPIKPE